MGRRSTRAGGFGAIAPATRRGGRSRTPSRIPDWTQPARSPSAPLHDPVRSRSKVAARGVPAVHRHHAIHPQRRHRCLYEVVETSADPSSIAPTERKRRRQVITDRTPPPWCLPWITRDAELHDTHGSPNGPGGTHTALWAGLVRRREGRSSGQGRLSAGGLPGVAAAVERASGRGFPEYVGGRGTHALRSLRVRQYPARSTRRD